MAKKTKKVNVKDQAKKTVMETLIPVLEAQGFTVYDGEEKFGMTKGTLVVRTEKCDIQLKPIAPKAGLDFYEMEEEEEETEEETKTEE